MAAYNCLQTPLLNESQLRQVHSQLYKILILQLCSSYLGKIAQIHYKNHITNICSYVFVKLLENLASIRTE